LSNKCKIASEQRLAFFGWEVEQYPVVDMVSVTVVEGRLQGEFCRRRSIAGHSGSLHSGNAI
jgi:hypothetical protein